MLPTDLLMTSSSLPTMAVTTILPCWTERHTGPMQVDTTDHSALPNQYKSSDTKNFHIY